VALLFFLYPCVVGHEREASVGLVKVGGSPLSVAMVMVGGIPIGLALVKHHRCWYLKRYVICW